MTTRQEARNITKAFIVDDDVTPAEILRHVYLWLQFEITTMQRDRHLRALDKLNKRGHKITNRLNDGLEIVNFRKNLNSL